MRILRALSLTILAAVLVTACSGSSPKKFKSKAGTVTDSKDPNNPNGTGDAVADEKAFELTLYPVLKANCATCHGDFQAPLFALADPIESYKNMMDTAKIDKADAKRSRMYLKVYEDQHQCWSGDCVADGEEILAAIEEWFGLSEAGEAAANIKHKTPELELASGTDVEPRDVDPASIVIQAESGTFAGVMASSEVLSANGGKVIAVPAGTAAAAAAANATNIARYTFNVTVPGNYRFLVKANSPVANNAGTLHFGINGTLVTMRLSTTGDADYLWTAGNNNNIATPTAAVTLAAGPATVEVRHAANRPLMDLVALSANPAFQGSETITGSKVKLLSFDLSEACGVSGAKLEIEAADHQGQGYKFKNPVITSPSPVKVQGMGIMVNGKPNAQYATFKLLDATVPANSKAVLAGGAMIVLKETDADKYAFTFDSCSGG